MFCIMIVSGLLSTMNVWVDKVEDMRLSVNDAYMILLMSGWMLFFMAAMKGDVSVSITGLSLAGFMIFCIRTQLFVSENQFLRGMIPHHSMAVHMCKHLKTQKIKILPFVEQMMDTQIKEIEYMKQPYLENQDVYLNI